MDLNEIFTVQNFFITLGAVIFFTVALIINKRRKTDNISKIKKIILSALLIAIHIVVTRFLSFQTPVLRISFEVLPLLLAGMILGPKYAILIGVMADILGATVFATSGASYFPGFTLNAVFVGLIAGTFLYETKEKPHSNLKFLLLVICVQAIIMAFVTMFLTPIWLTIMWGQTLGYYIAWGRFLSKLVVIAIEIPVISGIRLAIRPLLNKHVYEESEEEMK